MAESTTQEWARVMEHTARQAADFTGWWAEANRRTLEEVAGLSTSLAKEHARLAGDLTHVALDAALEAQRAAIRWQTSWPDAVTDPVRWAQRMLLDGVETAHRAMALVGAQARAVQQSVDRTLDLTRQAGQRLREVWTATAVRLGEVPRRAA